MKQKLNIFTFALVVAIIAASCNHQPKVVSPLNVPNTDSLKTYVDKARQTNDPQDLWYAACYYLEQHTSSDTTKAIELLDKSAAQNYPHAANTLGNIYSANSNSSFYNIKKAVESYELGVKKGSSGAMKNLADLYINGEGVNVDYKKAFELRKDAMLGLLNLAEKGDAAAQWELGCNQVDGVGVPKNEKAGFTWIKKSSDQGYVPSYYSMGVVYRDGRCGVEKNPKEAFQYFQKAAENGYTSAIYQVAQCFESGLGTERNDTLAFRNYLRAAKLGDYDALFSVALHYQNGSGTKRDYKEAFNWYKKCAERGSTSAQNNIGAMYLSGEGVSKDKAEAFKWFMKAAQSGHVFSQRVVGDCYYEGDGVEKDLTKAFEWYEKSAKGGDYTGKQRLAACYEYGIGTPKDATAAKYWYSQAQ